MLTFKLSNGTVLEITLDLKAVTLVQRWASGETQKIQIPLPDVKEIATQVRGLVRFFV